MRETIKEMVSDVACRMFPQKRDAIFAGEMVPKGQLDVLISHQLIKRAAAAGDTKMLRNQLANYWRGSSGDRFYETFTDRFQDSFLGEHYSVVEALKEVIAESDDDFTQLYEIGCGDGQVLNHLSENLPGVERFVGLDINENIIAQNRVNYGLTDLEFESGDAADWLQGNAEAGTVVMSYGGVMEYFLEEELVAMFKMLKQKSPVTIALVEPLYDGYDLQNETASKPSGQEHSFSHNHRHLLEQAGFEIKFQSEPQMEFRWMMIVAQG